MRSVPWRANLVIIAATDELTQDTVCMSNADHDELRHFGEQAAHWWDANGPLKTLHDINPARLRFIEQHQPLNGLKVLDVGCGGGVLSEAMARAGAQVTGIDLAEPLLEAARSHARQQGITLDYRHQAVESLVDTEAGCFDVVTCMEMLEHVPDPASIISACAQLTKPGGWVMVSTLNTTLKARVLGVWAAEYLLRLLPPGTHDADKFIAPHQLTAWARAAGLSPVILTGLHYNPLTRQTSLGMPADINYLMAFRKETDA